MKVETVGTWSRLELGRGRCRQIAEQEPGLHLGGTSAREAGVGTLRIEAQLNQSAAGSGT